MNRAVAVLVVFDLVDETRGGHGQGIVLKYLFFFEELSEGLVHQFSVDKDDLFRTIVVV